MASQPESRTRVWIESARHYPVLSIEPLCDALTRPTMLAQDTDAGSSATAGSRRHIDSQQADGRVGAHGGARLPPGEPSDCIYANGCPDCSTIAHHSRLDIVKQNLTGTNLSTCIGYACPLTSCVTRPTSCGLNWAEVVEDCEQGVSVAVKGNHYEECTVCRLNQPAALPFTGDQPAAGGPDRGPDLAVRVPPGHLGGPGQAPVLPHRCESPSARTVKLAHRPYCEEGHLAKQLQATQ